MRIGVVGAGTIGRVRIRSIRENASTELAAVFDTSAAAASAAAAGTNARVCSDLASFLDVDMDAVVVSTPPHLHEEACVGALARGRHVLVPYGWNYKPFVERAAGLIGEVGIGEIE